MSTPLLYPRPLPDLSEFAKTGLRDDGDPQLMHLAFWPNSASLEFKGDKDILIAGCGANAAARYALNHPNCRVTGIDHCPEAITHENTLKEKHGLSNLTLRTMALENASVLEAQYDLIDLTEVLHFTENPGAILKTLTAKLKPDGVIYINVFGQHGLYGVSLLRELFEQLGYTQTPEDLSEMRDTLKLLANNHLAAPYLYNSPELQTEAGVHSLFTDSPQASFRNGVSVNHCMTLLDEAGLQFQGWTEPYYYSPIGQIKPDTDFYNALMALPERERWQAMELFHGGIFRHRFYVCRTDRPAEHYQISFEGDDFLDYIPVRRISQIDPGSDEKAPLIQRPPMPAMTLDIPRARLFNLTNGENTIRQILEKVEFEGDWQGKINFAQNFYSVLFQMGYAFFKMP